MKRNDTGTKSQQEALQSGFGEIDYRFVLSALLWVGLWVTQPLSSRLFAQSQQFSSLSGTFWFDLDLNLVVSPYSEELQEGYRMKLEELIQASQRFVLEEVSYVFHGMVYGYQVVYRPPDRFHQQDETFLIIPENSEMISPDDLDIYHVSHIGKRFYYSVRKQLGSFESSSIEAWQQADKKTLQASGAVAFAAASNNVISKHNLKPELMIQLRKAAIDNAIKEAIRNYFRRKLRNKPTQIRVNLALSAIPEIAVGSGEILAKVRLHMGQYNIERYETR